ncbi:MAG: M14 family zinc carboxypeptidase, partial [Tenuifilaceae bacterium]|nr:M14 family zinc carboxypeptidase [Tenuifilaceae bacterium]
MKIRLAIVFILITTTPMAWAQDYYFRTIEPNKDRVNTLITQTVSIDKIVGDTIYAYASYVEFERFKKLGYALDILPYPSINAKNILMATSIEEMTGWDRYPTYEVYREMMKRFEEDYPSLCKLDSIGTSVQGRQLYVVKISDNVLEDE